LTVKIHRPNLYRSVRIDGSKTVDIRAGKAERQKEQVMPGKFDGKVAVVTGGNSGIGLATAERLAREGAKVFVTGRRNEQLDAAVKKIGHGAVGVQGDDDASYVNGAELFVDGGMVSV
jgi:NAD(P)-dependent dehydrogenase (short-subunit alcohol dehydrogenase family)